MNATLANIAIVAATTMTVVFLVPQMVKLIRTRDSAGVSGTWPALGFVVNVGWFLYMVEHGDEHRPLVRPEPIQDVLTYVATSREFGRGRPAVSEAGKRTCDHGNEGESALRALVGSGHAGSGSVQARTRKLGAPARSGAP